MEYNFSCYHFTKWVEYGRITYQEFIAVCILNGITILPAIVPNILVLYSIWRTPTLHTPAMALLCNLALSDLAVGLVAQPSLLYWITLELNAPAWPRDYCNAAITFGFTSTLFGVVSMLSIMAIGVDRYLALYLHLRYPALITMKKALLTCAIFWVCGLIIAIVWILFGIHVFSIILSISLGLIMCIVIVSYLQIYRVIKKHRSQIQAQELSTINEIDLNDASKTSVPNIRRIKKSVISSLYIFFAFIICYTPCFATFVYYEITHDDYFTPSFVKISTSIVLTNSSMNPILYCWKIRELRNAVLQILRVWWERIK